MQQIFLEQNSHLRSTTMIDGLLKAKRIAVIGNQGAGKTTLAVKLSGILDIEFVEIYWRANITIEQEAQAVKECTLQKESWIIDGDFGLLEFADTVIFIDFPLFLCLTGVIKRSLNYMKDWNFVSLKTYLQIPAKIVERVLFFKEVIQYRSKDEPAMLAKIGISKQQQNKITLKSRKDAQLLIESLNLAKAKH